MSLKAILKNAHDKTHELLLLKYINSKVKEERERCAKIAESFYTQFDADQPDVYLTWACKTIAKAIMEQEEE